MDFDYGLLAKYIINELSPEELGEVMEWRKLSDENKALFSYLARLRISWNYKKYNQDIRIDKALAKVNARIDRTKRYHSVRGLLKYAAVILLLASVTYGGYEYFKPEKYVNITVNPGGDMKKIMLADGTAVWLKEASSLKIPETFSAKYRHIFLQGEAFFDVAQKTEPFYISTAFLNVGVYGTAFELCVDNKEEKVETTLVRGKISLLDQDWKNVLDMVPGEKVTYKQDDNQYTTEKVDTNLCATWRLEQLVFENQTLREIANQLAVKFNVNVNIESSNLAERKFRCVINGNESLADILKILQYLAPIHCKIEGSEVFIKESQTYKK